MLCFYFWCIFFFYYDGVPSVSFVCWFSIKCESRMPISAIWHPFPRYFRILAFIWFWHRARTRLEQYSLWFIVQVKAQFVCVYVFVCYFSYIHLFAIKVHFVGNVFFLARSHSISVSFPHFICMCVCVCLSFYKAQKAKRNNNKERERVDLSWSERWTRAVNCSAWLLAYTSVHRIEEWERKP